MTHIFNYVIAAGFLATVIFAIISVALFFIVREITLWYFKINENTDSLKRIADSLEAIAFSRYKDDMQDIKVDIDSDENQGDKIEINT